MKHKQVLAHLQGATQPTCILLKGLDAGGVEHVAAREKDLGGHGRNKAAWNGLEGAYILKNIMHKKWDT